MAVDPKLYADIKAKDQDIADGYRDLMKDKDAIDENGIDRLLAVAAKDSSITDKEAAAIRLVLNAKLLTGPAFDRLQQRLVDVNGLAVFVAGGKLLDTDKDLTIVYEALAVAGTTVNFQSPGTRLEYNAAAYDAIKQLVKDKKIRVVVLLDHGIYINIVNVRGVYLPSMNTLALTVGAGTNHIVHELTHGFQDWMDVNADTNDIEADAHIAEQLSVSKLDPSYFASLKDDFSKAAGFILKNPGAAKFGNKDWSKMHKAASNAYDPMRKALGRPVKQDWSAGETFDEKKYLQGIMSKAASTTVKGSAPTPTPARAGRTPPAPVKQ